MTAFIACYDLKETDPKPHGEFLKQAAKRGWSVWISTTDEFKRLPNTTLTGDFSDVNAAGEALKDTRSATQTALGIAVALEKWYVGPIGAGLISSDEKKSK